MIGVGGLHHRLRAAPPPELFPRSLPGKQPTGPPGGGQAAGPAWRAGQARQGPPPSRPAELAELVCDHFGVQNGIVGHHFVTSWWTFGAKTPYTYEKSENVLFRSRKSEILVPASVNPVGFLIGFRETGWKCHFWMKFYEICMKIWSKYAVHVWKRWKLMIFDQKCKKMVFISLARTPAILNSKNPSKIRRLFYGGWWKKLKTKPTQLFYTCTTFSHQNFVTFRT